jgi:hypothetical protein
MSDPFRDGMEAALARSENLEEENEILRSEIADLRIKVEGLRESAANVPDVKGSPETRAIADKALEVLDQLEVVSRRGSKLRVALERGKTFTGAERPLDAVIPAAPDVLKRADALVEAPETGSPWSFPWAKPPPEPRASVSVVAVVALCFASFVGGIVVGIAHG